MRDDCADTDGCFQIFYEGKQRASIVSEICSPRRKEEDIAMSEDDDDLDKDLLGKQVIWIQLLTHFPLKLLIFL